MYRGSAAPPVRRWIGSNRRADLHATKIHKRAGAEGQGAAASAWLAATGQAGEQRAEASPSQACRPMEAAPENPCSLHTTVSRPPAPAAERAPAGRPAGPPGLPLSRPARYAGGTAQEQQSSLHATLHVISDAGGRDCDCDHTPDSTKPREEGRPGGRGQPARPTGGARCSSLRTRRAVPQAAEATF